MTVEWAVPVTPAAQVDPDNPWPGLESYEESSYAFFSGRTTEADELLRRILDEPVTVLFGKSGLGKSSLLKAGVFPRLREKDLLPIFLRLQIRSGSEPLIRQVRRGLLDELSARGIDYPEIRDDETLWEYLHRANQEFWTDQNRLVRVVFVFDQFEELFTLGTAVPAAVEALREDLADLAENRIPAAVATRLEHRSAGELGLDVQAMPYKIVIALREDFLADLEGWRLTMPSLRRNRMRLLPMGTAQALQAVCNERTNHLVSEPLGRRIVAFLSSGPGTGDVAPGAEVPGPAVEPALLSLFCRGINEHRKRDRKAEFDVALLEGGKDTIVADFYKSSLKDQPERVRRFIEEDLITEHGYRNSYSVEDAVGRKAVTAAELGALINRHLLRHEHHLGTERVELTHDLLTKAVVEERDARRRAEGSERERRNRWKKLGAVAVIGGLLIVPVLATLAIRASRAESRASAQADVARKASQRANDQARLASAAASRASVEAERASAEAERASEQTRLATDETRRANDERSRANAETSRSKSREFAAVAGLTIDKDPELAIAIAMEGLKQADTGEARSALLDAARYVWPSVELDPKSLGGDPVAVALGADGHRLAVLAGQTITLWDVTARRPRQVWKQSVPAGSSLVAFTPDQKRIAIFASESITLRDAPSGRNASAITIESPSDQVRDPNFVFSPDGGWLAWQQTGQALALLDFAHPNQKPESVRVNGGVLGFAVAEGGTRITTVSDRPLRADVVTRQADGKWTPPQTFDLSACVNPQSVSPGARGLSATWKGRKCIYTISGEGPSRPRQVDVEGEISDIVWSPRGSAFAEVQSRDLIVGRMDAAGALENRIKGGHGIERLNDLTRLISVAESGNRLAFIDADEHKLVKIFSLGDHKPFLTGFNTRLFAVSPDGAWFATGRTGLSEKTVEVDVIPLERNFALDRDAGARKRITLDALPRELHASSDSLVVVLNETTLVYDVATSRLRFPPLMGQAQTLGDTGELLLLEPTALMKSWKVVKTRDGTQVASWEAERADGSRANMVTVSPNGGAIAILQERGKTIDATLFHVLVYSIMGTTLVRTGEIGGLPDPGAVPADDGRTMVNGGEGVYMVSAGARSDRTAPMLPVQPTVSPSGRFEVRIESSDGTSGRTMTLVRRADKAVVKRFATATEHVFSSDDRWLALWDERGVQVVDLAQGTIKLSLNQADVEHARFVGDNTMLSVRLDSETMLLPLDRGLMERFATWLAPRALTSKERCLYGLAGDCR